MATGKTAGSKKDASTQKVRKLDGKVVKIVLYNGNAVGHGKYLAGSVDGELVVDKDGKPLHYAEVGKLEKA